MSLVAFLNPISAASAKPLTVFLNPALLKLTIISVKLLTVTPPSKATLVVRV